MVVSMSDKEFSRLSVLMDAQVGRLRIEDAAQLLQLNRRQITRPSAWTVMRRAIGPPALPS
jgi:hypothetical protein